MHEKFPARSESDNAWLERCLDLVEQLRNELFPQNIRLPRSVDDSALGSGTGRSRIASDGWQSVGTWESVHQALENLGPGSSAFVLTGRSSGDGLNRGHAFAAYHTASYSQTPEQLRQLDGTRVHWVELLSGSRPLTTEIPGLAAVNAHVVLVDAYGTIHVGDLPNELRSPGTAEALIDAPTSRQYGAIGVEVELFRKISAPTNMDLGYGTVLARHVSGIEIKIDSERLYLVGGVKYFPERELAEAAGYSNSKSSYFNVPELVTPPLAVIPGDAGRVASRDGLDALMSTWRALNIASQQSRPVPLEHAQLGHGWTVTPAGRLAALLPQIMTNEEAAYVQMTAGFTPRGLAKAQALAYTLGGAIGPNSQQFLMRGREFAVEIVADFTSRISGQAVSRSEVPYLINVPGIDELYGYAWLFFMHVAAVPVTKRVRYGLIKNNLSLVSRTDFAEIRSVLSAPIRGFMRHQRHEIENSFERHLASLLQSFGVSSDDALNETTGPHKPTVRDYLATALVGVADNGSAVSQNDVLMTEGSPTQLDRNRGHMLVPRVLLEFRRLRSTGHSRGLITPQEALSTFGSISQAVWEDDFRAGQPRDISEQSIYAALGAVRTHPGMGFSHILELAQNTFIGDGGRNRAILSFHEAEDLAAKVVALSQDEVVPEQLRQRLEQLIEKVRIYHPSQTDTRVDDVSPVESATRHALRALGLLVRSRHANSSRVGGQRTPRSQRQGPRYLTQEAEDLARADEVDMALPVGNPVTREAWWHHRPGAPSAAVRAERFIAASSSSAEAASGRLNFHPEGWTANIAMDVRRVQATDGRWVRDITLTVPARLGPGFSTIDDLKSLQKHGESIFAAHINHGLVLPQSGDQLHVGVLFVYDPENPEAVEFSRTNDPMDSTQNYIRLHAISGNQSPSERTAAQQRNDAQLLHELLHRAGVVDHYYADDLAVHSAAQRHGVMSGNPDLSQGALTRGDLAEIERMSASGEPLHDHPLPATESSQEPLSPPAEARGPVVFMVSASDGVAQGLLRHLQDKIAAAWASSTGTTLTEVQAILTADPAVRRLLSLLSARTTPNNPTPAQPTTAPAPIAHPLSSHEYTLLTTALHQHTQQRDASTPGTKLPAETKVERGSDRPRQAIPDASAPTSHTLTHKTGHTTSRRITTESADHPLLGPTDDRHLLNLNPHFTYIDTHIDAQLDHPLLHQLFTDPETMTDHEKTQALDALVERLGGPHPPLNQRRRITVHPPYKFMLAIIAAQELATRETLGVYLQHHPQPDPHNTTPPAPTLIHLCPPN
ncbi:hypothetical protein [Streptomyces sp. NPDC090080]|uniref:hypothetical protein n=1 Tax=Streptomyces sp. NPDC090080 TaxID=3365939 RepID=UPI0037F173FD